MSKSLEDDAIKGTDVDPKVEKRRNKTQDQINQLIKGRGNLENELKDLTGEDNEEEDEEEDEE